MDKLQLIYSIADSKIDYIQKYGFAKAGCNGPYNNKDTSVRNSAHWIITYSYLWEETQNTIYFEMVKLLSEYLLESDNYGISGSICARLDKRFDKTNGLIGQAWVIEALVKASEILNDDRFYKKAKDLFLLQPYNETKKIWDVLDCDNNKCYDQVYNHQLWFAASGGLILDYEYDAYIDEMIKSFLLQSEKRLFNVHEDGLIIHKADFELNKQEELRNIQINRKRKIDSFFDAPIKVILKKIKSKISKQTFGQGLEQGYHLFDLYGFALLYNRYFNEPIFKSNKFNLALKYICDENNIINLMKPCGGHSFNKFSFSYNSPAFEYIYVCKKFNLEPTFDFVLFEFQLEKLYNKEKKSFTENCNDPETLDARIYELVRALDDHKIN